MKKYTGKNRSVRYLIALALAVSTLTATPAQAAVVTFNCPGGGSYTVDNGVLDDMYTNECKGAVVLDSSVTRINYATYVLAGVTSILIPSTTTLIQNQPFVGGDDIVEINVDSSNANYKSVDGILYNKAGTTLIQYPQAKTGSTFTVPSSVTTIGNYAFSCAVNLNVLTIHDGVTSADYIDRLNGCNANGISEYVVGSGNANYTVIDGVLFNKAATTLVSYPVNKAGSSYVMPSTVTTINQSAMGYSIDSRLKTVTLSPNLTTIKYYAFISLNLETLELPASLTTIEALGLNSIKSVTIAAGNTSFALSDGALYNYALTTMYTYFPNSARKSFVIPASVTSINDFIFGNGLDADLTRLTINTPLSSGSSTQSFWQTKYLILGENFTTTDNFSSWYFEYLVAVNYCGTDAQTISKINAKLVGWNNAKLVCETEAPQFTISSGSETVTSGVAIQGFTIESTDAPDFYSISPEAYLYGLDFDTTTGLLSGTSYYSGTTVDFDITGSNAFGDTTVTYTVETISNEPPYIAPTPVPFLNSVTKPKMNLKDGKYVCTAGTYEFGYTIDGVIDGSTSGMVTPSKYTYNLLINGVADSALTATTAITSNSWSITQPSSGSLVSCSVAVTVNSLSIGALSTDNSDGVAAAQSAQSTGIKTANATYKAVAKATPLAYQKALVDSRAVWRKQTDAIRANYAVVLDRIKTTSGSKMISDVATATEVTNAAKMKANDDYAASKAAAYVAADEATKAANEAKTVAIAKAKATYGTYIESIGHGVLIP
jgi:hypothetical protein